MAESELAILAAQCLDRRIPDKSALATEIAAWVKNRNTDNTKADWQFTADDARVKLKHLYPSIYAHFRPIFDETVTGSGPTLGEILPVRCETDPQSSAPAHDA